MQINRTQFASLRSSIIISHFVVSSDNYLAHGLPLADELQTTAKNIYTTLTAAQQ